MKSKIKSLVGQKFGRLLVTHDAGRTRTKQVLWGCICDCGNEHVSRGPDLKRNKTKSCGCHKREITIRRNKETASRGGLTHTPTGVSWSSMMSRCYNPNLGEKNHIYYGRVRVCEFLRSGPINLTIIIGERPRGHTLDRTDTEGNYSCGQCAECLTNKWFQNVRWLTPKQQGRNQRTNRLIEINGVSKPVCVWVEEYGLNHSAFRDRLARGWSGEKLLLPIRQMKLH